MDSVNTTDGSEDDCQSLAKRYIEANPDAHSEDGFIQWMVDLNPNFKTDKIFKVRAPICYRIEDCKHKMSQSSK